MNNRFINFLEFVTDDSEAKAKNLYHPTKKLRIWEAQDGDFWRLLVKNNILRGRNLANVEVRIVQCAETLGVWDGQTFEDTGKRAGLRKQYCESYSEFILKLNEASTQSRYRQFALTRSNGQRVLGTVRETATDLDSYAAKVQKHFEAYPFTNVIVHRKGSLLAVRVYTNDRFYMDDEEVSIGIGQVPESNSNSPTLSSVLLETVSYPARFSFEVNIENVEPGNRFELNGISYEAQSGDEVETVKRALLGTASRLIVPQTQVNSVLATRGSRSVVNSNSPSIILYYVDTDSGNDRYEVVIGASVAAGNTFQIQATGEPLKSFTATATDTATTVKAALVEVSGYYEVPEGTVPEWLAVAGTQRIDNVNEPKIYLSDQQVIAAVDKKKYRVIVGNDVEKGNEYTLGEESYIAASTDTAESVGIALGLGGAVGTVEIAETDSLVCYAKLGKKYTVEDVADVSILQHPRIYKSNQWVLEIPWSDLLLEKTYSLQLYDTVALEVLGYSNLVYLTEKSDGTAVLEVADSFEAHGYEYFEKTTQQIRVPIFMRTSQQRTVENRVPLLNGGYRRASTVIEIIRELITRTETSEFHQVLAAWLKHSFVWVDGTAYYSEGGYMENIVSPLSQTLQAKATLVMAGERNNKTTYFTSDSKPLRCGSTPLYGFVYGLRVILKTDSFENELQEGSNVVYAGDYEMVIYNDGDARTIRIAPEGLESVKVMVPGQSVARLKRLRVESGKTLEIYSEKTTAPSVTYQPEYTSEAFVINGYTCEKVIAQTADFSDDFSDDFNNGN
jgi:hypothetical protein